MKTILLTLSLLCTASLLQSQEHFFKVLNLGRTLDSAYYVNLGDKTPLYLRHGTPSDRYGLSKEQLLKIFKDNGSLESPTDVTLVSEVDLPTDSKMSFVVLVPKGNSKNPVYHSIVTDDSLAGFPAGSYRLFNFTPKRLYTRIGEATTVLEPLDHKIIPIQIEGRKNPPLLIAGKDDTGDFEALYKGRVPWKFNKRYTLIAMSHPAKPDSIKVDVKAEKANESVDAKGNLITGEEKPPPGRLVTVHMPFRQERHPLLLRSSLNEDVDLPALAGQVYQTTIRTRSPLDLMEMKPLPEEHMEYLRKAKREKLWLGADEMDLDDPKVNSKRSRIARAKIDNSWTTLSLFLVPLKAGSSKQRVTALSDSEYGFPDGSLRLVNLSGSDLQLVIDGVESTLEDGQGHVIGADQFPLKPGAISLTAKRGGQVLELDSAEINQQAESKPNLLLYAPIDGQKTLKYLFLPR